MMPIRGGELALYSDLPPEEAGPYYELLEPHSQDAFETPVDHIAADVQTIPLAYVVTEQDQVFSPAAQRALASSVPGMRVVGIESSHSPFASQPERLADIIVDISRTKA